MRLLDAVDRAGDMPPVLVGIMPLRDFDHAEYLQNEVPDTFIPPVIRDRLRQTGGRRGAAGLEIAAGLVREVRETRRAGGVVLSSPNGNVEELTALLGLTARVFPEGSKAG